MNKSWIVLVSMAALGACGDTGSDSTGSGGKGGAAATGATSSGTTSATTSSATGSTSATGGETCSPACGAGFTCCGSKCVNTQNDPLNCGVCDVECKDPTPLCQGMCVTPECNTPMQCTTGTCCNTECCTGTQICCDVQSAGPSMGPKCFEPVDGTCPVGCPLCD